VRYKSGVKGPSPGAERWLSVNLRRIVGFLFLALIIWLVLTQPDTAAAIVRNIFAVLETAAVNITRFFTSVF
jgi:thiol:disulfide interchange protein